MSVSSGAPTFAGLRRGVRPAAAADGKAEITQAVGEAFVQRMLADITGGPAGQVGQLREVIGVVKDLDDVQTGRRSRQQADLEEVLDELAAVRKDLKKAKSGGDGDTSLIGLMLKGLMDQQTKAEERWIAWQEKQEEREREREKERRELEQGSTTQFFAKFGYDALQGQLTKDPLDEYKRQHAFWSDVLGSSSQEKAADQRWEKQEEYRLREKEIEAKYGAEEKEAGRRVEGLQQLATIAAAVTGQAPPGGPPPGVFRYTCGACGQEFAVPNPTLAHVCPSCGAALQAPAGDG